MEARRAHNPEVVGSSPTSATTKADTKRCLFFIIYLDSNLRHVAPNAQAFGRNSPGDCFVASAQSRSYLRNHQSRHQTVSVFYYLFGLEPTTRGSKCASIWEKQSGGLFRSECAISVLPPQPPRQTPNRCLFFYSPFGLEPTTRGSKCASIWEKQSGGLFRSECAISVLPPQPPRRRLFTPSFFFYRTQDHIRTAHKQAPEIPVSVFCLSTRKAH